MKCVEAKSVTLTKYRNRLTWLSIFPSPVKTKRNEMEPVADSHSNVVAVQATNDDASASKLWVPISFLLSSISHMLI